MASIQKRPNDKWRARYRDPAGKEHARHFDRKTDAQRWLDEVSADMLTGRYVDPRAGRKTFRVWFNEFSDRQIWAPTTTAAAASTLRLVPFADMPLSAIRRADIERWVKAMSTSSPRRPGGLAANTIASRLHFVRMAMRAAVVERLIAEDPTAGVKTPRDARTSLSRIRDIPTPEQMGKIIAAADEDFRGFIATCAFAGLRPGEAAGLQVGDVDFLRRVIHVRRQIQGHSIATMHECPPKYGSSREVPVPAALTDMLAAHIQKFGVRGESGWLFTREGHLFGRRLYGALWRRALSGAGLSGFTPHACRHYFASGLIAAGCDVVTVQRALGHSSAAITLSVYSHEWPTAEDRTRSAAADIMAHTCPPADSVRTEEAK